MRETSSVVYVVDDDVSMRESVASLLRSAGVGVTTFASAQEVLLRCRTERPSCLVLDVKLPGLSGLEVQQELVSTNVRVPIIFLTGYADVPTSVRAMKSGALEFLTKPFDGEALIAAVQLGIARSRPAGCRDKAGQAADAREEFLAIASHELRTPLTVLQLTVQGLRRGGAVLEGPRFEEKLGRLQSQVNRLGGLVVNLLDGARAAAGLDLHFEPVSLADLVAEVVERVRSDAGRAGSCVELQRSDAGVGYWDRARVGQVVANLLSNAVKFGEGKPITVSTGLSGDTAWLEVRDRGIGIDPEFRDRLFTRFAQGVSARSYGGLGLGLFLSRRIVEAHGGSIHVESEPGQGATMRVELPLATDALDARSMRSTALGIAGVH